MKKINFIKLPRGDLLTRSFVQNQTTCPIVSIFYNQYLKFSDFTYIL